MRISKLQCQVCEKNFDAKRVDAKTCSAACRQQMCKARKGSDVKSKIALSDQSFSDLLIIRSHAPAAAEKIDYIIGAWGAFAAEWAIGAVKEALL